MSDFVSGTLELSRVAEWMNVDVDNEDADNYVSKDVIQTLIASAISEADKFTSQSLFAVKTETETYQLDLDTERYFFRHGGVQSIESMTLNGEVIPSENYVLYENKFIFSVAYNGYVEIEYTYGFATPPADVLFASMKYIASLLEVYRKLPVRTTQVVAENSGESQIQYALNTAQRNALAEYHTILRPYVYQGAIGDFG